MVTTTPEEFVTRLREAFVYEGKPFGRLRFIEEEQGAHWNKITTGLKGYAAAADAFKCFFLETVEAINIEIRTKVITQMSEFYPLLSSAARGAMPRMRSEAFSAIISTQALIDVPLQTIYRASWPFVWIIVAGMVLCALFPELITLLPRLSGPN